MKKRIVLALLVIPIGIAFARTESSLTGTQSMNIGEGETIMINEGEIPTGRALGAQKATSGEDRSQSRSLTLTTKIGQDKTAMFGTLSESLTASKPLDMQDGKSRDATGYITTGGTLGTQSYTTGASMSAQSYTAGQSAGTQGYGPKDEGLTKDLVP